MRRSGAAGWGISTCRNWWRWDRLAELQRLPEANPVGTSRVQIETAGASAMLGPLRGMKGVREATIFGRSIHALVETEQVDALRARFPSAEIKTIVPSLEDVFVTLTYKIMEHDDMKQRRVVLRALAGVPEGVSRILCAIRGRSFLRC